jgi:hypothetical protein
MHNVKGVNREIRPIKEGVHNIGPPLPGVIRTASPSDALAKDWQTTSDDYGAWRRLLQNSRERG